MSQISELIGSIADKMRASVETLQAQSAPIDALLVDVSALPGVSFEISHSLSSLYAYSDETARSSICVTMRGIDREQLHALVADREALFWFEPKDTRSVLITANSITLHVIAIKEEA